MIFGTRLARVDPNALLGPSRPAGKRQFDSDCQRYEMAKSTISTILKHKEVLKKADVAIGVTAISKQRPQIMEEMEKLLLIFTKEKMLAGDSISEALICEKALQIYCTACAHLRLH
ncbi:hypothetical protein FHG87_016224 [Trinorchestia longiramus]|nr:hypothetical protein FHG87_016224 [Trinorchestia longiramus]